MAGRGALGSQRAAKRQSRDNIKNHEQLPNAGKDVRELAVLKRKAMLQRELKAVRRICYCSHVGEVGEKLFAKAQELGLSGTWIKIKTSMVGMWTKSGRSGTSRATVASIDSQSDVRCQRID